jgi:hypothetical protein
MLCAMLTLWACIDSQVFLASSEYLAPVPQSASPTQEDSDDDDYVFDLTTGDPAPCPQTVVARVCLSITSHRRPLLTAFCEHNYRNGIGTPLLC